MKGLYSLFFVFMFYYWPLSSTATATEESVATFLVDGMLSETANQVVRLDPDMSCIFRFLPAEGVEDVFSANVQAEDDATSTNPATYIKRLRSAAPNCITLSERGGYWNYRVCPGSEVLQYHEGDTYSLGRFLGFNKDRLTEEYGKGDSCEVEPGKTIQRSSRVKYYCATADSIHDVAEVATCTYELSVGSPTLCEHSAFATIDTTSHSQMIPATQMDLFSSWTLVARRDSLSGVVTCVAEHVLSESGVAHPKFGYVQLSVQGGSKSKAGTFVARGPNRVAIPSDILEAQQCTVQSRSLVHLEYVRVTCDLGNG